MFRTSAIKAFLALGSLIASAGLSLANVSATGTFSRPDNAAATDVVVSFRDAQGNERYTPVTVTIPSPCSATRKRDLIKAALVAAAHDVTDDGATGTSLTINNLLDGTKVKFNPGETKEKRDLFTVSRAVAATISFEGPFIPFDRPSLPAVFTAGIITDVGILDVQISAQELNFQTDGPIICQALFQRLAPHAPLYGAEINYAGDRLEVYFDPAYTVTQGGIIFGTSSPSPGCSGEVASDGNAEPCPGDVNGDGLVDLSDLARVLAAYGMTANDPGFDPACDFDHDGDVDLDDLARVLANYGQPCD